MADIKLVKSVVNGTTRDLKEVATGDTISADLISDGATNKAYTGTEQSKLSGISTGAEVNVQSDWNQSTNTEDDYIKNKPTLGTAAAKNIPVTGDASATEVVYGSDTRLTNDRNAADVSAWAKNATKPSYTYSEVGADQSGAASGAVSSHEGTYNHSNYNTAYGWGNHASAGYEVASNKSNDISGDAASTTKYPSVKAFKDYADQLIGAANAVVYKGTTNCSANPNYPAADAGHIYIVSVAGKIGGASGIAVEVGDMFICTTDGTTTGDQATVGDKWNVIQKNIADYVIGPSSVTDATIPLFDGVTGKLLKGSSYTPASFAAALGADDNYVTDDEKTKIGTIESNADVTDAGNVGSSINGSTPKTSMADADKVAIIDTEASNVLKTLSWSYVKSILKTYFDTLYNKYVHPNHSGDVTSVADGAQTIAAKAVTLAKMNDLAANTIIGRVTQSTGVPEALSATNVRTIINVADGATANTKAAGSDIDTGTDDSKFLTSKALADSNRRKGISQILRFTLVDPKSAYGKDHEFCIWAKTDAAITITNIEVTCDADPTTEPTGDIKWADAFIGLGNATVINDFDTTAGVRSDSSITAGSVAAGKCIYISFDAEPDAALTQISFAITYDYD